MNNSPAGSRLCYIRGGWVTRPWSDNCVKTRDIARFLLLTWSIKRQAHVSIDFLDIVDIQLTNDAARGTRAAGCDDGIATL